MTNKHHLLVLDPTAFSGGSKVATTTILNLLDPKKMRITVLTADKFSWHSNAFRCVHLYEPRWLANKEQGLGYFIRHAFIMLNLLMVRLRFGKFDLALGASGPGVDFAIYLLKPLLKMKLIQLIHGPVAASRTIAKCLKSADQVHYLESSTDSLQAALLRLDSKQTTLPHHFHLLKNGLSDEAWPSACQTQYPVIFWAASLLKWKGLDTLLDALQNIDTKIRPLTHICYIRPQGVQLPISQAPVKMQSVDWYENPVNLNQLRASANIFVSTSKNEPFGLSILEAMAAGLCILIPKDGAYWDRTLEHNIDCLKYQPGDADDLKKKLLMVSLNMPLLIKLGKQAAKVALGYSANKQYKHIKNSIEQINQPANKGDQTEGSIL